MGRACPFDLIAHTLLSTSILPRLSTSPRVLISQQALAQLYDSTPPLIFLAAPPRFTWYSWVLLVELAHRILRVESIHLHLSLMGGSNCLCGLLLLILLIRAEISVKAKGYPSTPSWSTTARKVLRRADMASARDLYLPDTSSCTTSRCCGPSVEGALCFRLSIASSASAGSEVVGNTRRH